MRKSIIFSILIFIACKLFGQPFMLEVQIANQPDSPVILGKVHGDKFLPVDTLEVQPVKDTRITYRFPGNSPTGMYRLIFGQTTYARVMNEPPQQLDFIFNNENIFLTTDFKAPEDSLTVFRSEENKVWFGFKRKEKELSEKLGWAEKELDYYRDAGDTNFPDAVTNRITQSITRYHRLQKERDSLITNTVEQYPGLFASKLIAMYREPFLDGNLARQQRQEIFKSEYFKLLDFSDEMLLNSAVYTEKVFKYLMSYARHGLPRGQQEQEFMRAVDVILSSIHTMTPSHRMNIKVYEFILDYLVRGFERLQLENLIVYISENYVNTTCQTDEKTTLERRLASRQMKPGTIVPDFTLTDLNGDPVALSHILKKQNLLVFWASWCPHCMEMFPKLKARRQLNTSGNFEIIAVSLDTVRTGWQTGVFEAGIESWYNLSDLKGWDGKVAEDYNVFATPTMFLIGKNREIIGRPGTLHDLKNLFEQR